MKYKTHETKNQTQRHRDKDSNIQTRHRKTTSKTIVEAQTGTNKPKFIYNQAKKLKNTREYEIASLKEDYKYYIIPSFWSLLL